MDKKKEEETVALYYTWKNVLVVTLFYVYPIIMILFPFLSFFLFPTARTIIIYVKNSLTVILFDAYWTDRSLSLSLDFPIARIMIISV